MINNKKSTGVKQHLGSFSSSEELHRNDNNLNNRATELSLKDQLRQKYTSKADMSRPHHELKLFSNNQQ